jgi:hypothetical protein
MRPRRLRGGMLPSWLVLACAMGLGAGLSGCASTAPDLLGTAAPAQTSQGDLLSSIRTVALASGVPLPMTREQREEAIIAQAIAEHEMRHP